MPYFCFLFNPNCKLKTREREKKLSCSLSLSLVGMEGLCASILLDKNDPTKDDRKGDWMVGVHV